MASKEDMGWASKNAGLYWKRFGFVLHIFFDVKS